ncbi:MAG: bifunctional nuclease family protein [Candidatus Tectomicrobia bacterium]|uniref:Bifunctional nuclease family protein n=1 Tax=Tectimicrobiota bacterium TaxID=2528274 RepID=A0A933LPS3_UNCTE|nr:bifunctional nuclease family protein [Candidatus Tectomicrobia bacterium]
MNRLKLRRKILGFYILILISISLPLMAGIAKENLVKVDVKAVTQDPLSGSPMVLLEDKAGERLLPIWIGPSEARSILTELEGIPQKRPMTHDLLKTIIYDLKAKVKSVVITELRDNTFYSSIILEKGGRDLTIDSRPSDAIALAMRANAPIFLESKILSTAQTIDISSPHAIQRVKGDYGFSFQDLTPSLSEYFKAKDVNGVLISEIQEGGLAQKAGLKEGDIVLKVNDEMITNSNDFSKAIEKIKGEELIQIQVARSGETMSVNLSKAKVGKDK